MALIDRIRSHRVYLDSNVFIYAFEDYPQYAGCADILRALVDDEFEGVTSEIGLIEILPKPVHTGRPELADRYLETMDRAPGLTLVPVSREIILRAISLRAAARLNSLDALHIATALDASCDLFVTNDLRLKPPLNLTVVHLQPRSN